MGVAIGPTATSIELLRWTPSEEQVDIGSFQEVVINLILILERPYYGNGYMSPIIHKLQGSMDLGPVADLQSRLTTRYRIAELVVRGVINIVPVFGFHGSCAVVHFEGRVGGLLGYVADLANEADARQLHVVELDLAARVELFGFEDLHYGYWAEGVFVVALGKGYRLNSEQGEERIL